MFSLLGSSSLTLLFVVLGVLTENYFLAPFINVYLNNKAYLQLVIYWLQKTND